jgi:hypothetical protein
MTESERIAYQAETDRLRAANVARVQADAANLRAYEAGVRAALQALRDTDHAAAIVIDRDVYPLLRGVGAPDRMRLQVEDDHETAEGVWFWIELGHGPGDGCDPSDPRGGVRPEPWSIAHTTQRTAASWP